MNIKFPVMRVVLGGCLLLALATGVRAEESAVNGPRTYTDNRGRSIVASVVSIDVSSVVLRRESDKKEFTFPIVGLSPADQVFLAENRAALGGMANAGKPAPLPYRKITGTEVAKVRRFAVDVLIDGASGKRHLDRWPQRPKLTLRGTGADIAIYGKKTFEDFSEAAGLPVVPNPESEIILCVGSRDEIMDMSNELDGHHQPSQTWSWWRKPLPRGGGYRITIFIVADKSQDERNRQNLFRVLAQLFGCAGRSTEFSQSGFSERKAGTELDAIDRQLLRLLYAHLPEMVVRDDILGAVDKNWVAMLGAPPAGPEKSPEL